MHYQGYYKVLVVKIQEKSPCGSGRKRGRTAIIKSSGFFSLTKGDRLCHRSCLWQVVSAEGKEGCLCSPLQPLSISSIGKNKQAKSRVDKKKDLKKIDWGCHNQGREYGTWVKREATLLDKGQKPLWRLQLKT